MLKLVSKSDSNVVLELNRSRLAIGRDEANALSLDDESVSGFHAEIFVDEDRAELIDLGSTNGTFVDGNQIRGRCALKAWQKVRFGQVEMEVIDPERRRPTTTMAAIGDDLLPDRSDPSPIQSSQVKKERTGAIKGRLDLISGGTHPKAFELRSSITVGREAPSELRLASDMVSSSHAKLEWRGDELYVTDLESTNGTRINGKRISTARVKSGDRIAFDEIEYVFTSHAETQRGGTRVNPALGGRGGTTVRPVAEIQGVSRRMPSSDGDETPGRGIPSVAASKETRHQSSVTAGTTGKDPRLSNDLDGTRVQKSVEPPKRAPLLPSERSRPFKSTQDGQSRQLAQSAPVNVAASTNEVVPEPEASGYESRSKHRDSQQVVVKQGGNGCIIALLVIILLIVALPLIAVAFKVGFLLSIIASIRSFIPFF